ncbi:hypothetical protein E2C01_031526 [Portunus trituberculatus]|uniref:Uncharacterized protein n=1 Tax=Portunus trituberculatus TaxID=210409 RepID=A0A5B7EX33_PORTR|nr:hypothetical protein [Portunus trituberculatus]
MALAGRNSRGVIHRRALRVGAWNILHLIDCPEVGSGRLWSVWAENARLWSVDREREVVDWSGYTDI